MKKVDNTLIEKVLAEARKSPRKRAMFCFHEKDETLQRMVNACLCETYVRPHKHENPDKLEIYSILRGRVAAVNFDDSGEISDCVILEESGHNKSAEIPPRTWHNFVVLSEEAVLYIVIEGRYDSSTHKGFASWAPEEGSDAVTDYLEGLRRRARYIST